MILKYYGTAAAEGFPGLFCDCESCRKALKASGKNIRRRSQACVDGKILIDLGPDTYSAYLFDGLDLPNIETCLLTHSHEDHFCTSSLAMKLEHYAHGDIKPLNIYGTKESGDDERYGIKSAINGRLDATDRMHYIEIEPFKSFEAEGYKIMPLKAKHDPKCNPVIYEIQKDGKTMLYGNDTAYLPQETWDYIEQNKPFYNLVSLDCCQAILPWVTQSHMGIDECVKIKERMISLGVADENTVFVLHHFSHNCKVTHDELVPIAKEKGFEVAYDTLEIEF